MNWYAVHTHVGKEAQAKEALEVELRNAALEAQIVVPADKVIQITRNTDTFTSPRMHSGYIMVYADLSDELLKVLQKTPHITGLSGKKPRLLSDDEATFVIEQAMGTAMRVRITSSFHVGDSIRVNDGPFREFNGTVEAVKPEKGKLRILISIFGRPTPIELDIAQVERG